VYWRRRAVVLGALLLGVIVLFVSCSGGDDSKRGTGASSKAPSPAPSVSTPDDDASFTDPGPGAGNPSLPDPSDLTSAGTGDGTGTGDGDGTGTGTGDGDGTGTGTGDGSTDTNVTVPADGSCTDAEISVTPVPAATTVRRGTPLGLRLKIKNISARTCKRDVGADLQELYIEQGALKVWSSDTCGTAKGSQVLSFAPNDEREYNVTWNGKRANKCAAGLAAGTAPTPGQYEVRGRLGAKVSAPVALDIVA
jgi:hypothetical protein